MQKYLSIYSGMYLKRQCAHIHMCLIRCHCPVAAVLPVIVPGQVPSLPRKMGSSCSSEQCLTELQPQRTALNSVLPHPPFISTLHAPLPSFHIPSFPHTFPTLSHQLLLNQTVESITAFGSPKSGISCVVSSIW